MVQIHNISPSDGSLAQFAKATVGLPLLVFDVFQTNIALQRQLPFIM